MRQVARHKPGCPCAVKILRNPARRSVAARNPLCQVRGLTSYLDRERGADSLLALGKAAEEGGAEAMKSMLKAVDAAVA
mgnify:CR=1 FL=1